MNSYSLKLDGGLLRRGFWLYVCEIRHSSGRYFYVGRTGDSSSNHAVAPFTRFTVHLNHKLATNNMLNKHLENAHISPQDCQFEFLALGPFYEETDETVQHRLRVREVGAMETALAEAFRNLAGNGCNFTVLGTHGKAGTYDADKFSAVLRAVGAKFPDIKFASNP